MLLGSGENIRLQDKPLVSQAGCNVQAPCQTQVVASQFPKFLKPQPAAHPGPARRRQKKITKLKEQVVSHPVSGQTEAHVAAACGDRVLLRHLFLHRPDLLSAVDSNGETPAHAAARSGGRRAVGYLLKVLPKLFLQRNCSGQLPAHVAATSRRGLVCFWRISSHAQCC
jgi:hypothetical protein